MDDDLQLRPLGIAYTLAGNILFAVGIGRLAEVDGAFDWIQPALFMGVGLLLANLATRFGGGNWLVQFLFIGVNFLWGAFHAHDSFDRWFGLGMGLTFSISGGLSILMAIWAHGLRTALTQRPGAVILAPGRRPVAFSADALADAIRDAERSQGRGVESPAGTETEDTTDPEASPATD